MIALTSILGFLMRTQVYKQKNMEILLSDTSKGKNSFFSQEKRFFEAFINIFSSFLSQNSLFDITKKTELSLSLTLCGKSKISSLNRDYRAKNKITDVLSFPVFDSFTKDDLQGAPLIELGDIYICREVAKIQSKEFEISLGEEVLQQLVHGTLHLCGYDHERSENDASIMFDLEDKLVKKIFKLLKK